MTTAARPTWDTAKGGSTMRERDLSAMSKQYSSRDLPSHTKLKTREAGQGTSEEHGRKDFRRELEDRERVALRDRRAEKARREALRPTASIKNTALRDPNKAPIASRLPKHFSKYVPGPLVPTHPSSLIVADCYG